MKYKNLSAILLIIICLFITGCGNNETKNAVTLDEFNNVASNISLVVTDNTETYKKSVDYISEASIIVDEDMSIEMIKYIDTDYANKAQENHIENFKTRRSTAASEIKDKGKNYYSYKLVSNGRYMFSIRVDETLLFGSVLLEDKELAEELINDLGY